MIRLSDSVASDDEDSAVAKSDNEEEEDKDEDEDQGSTSSPSPSKETRVMHGEETTDVLENLWADAERRSAKFTSCHIDDLVSHLATDALKDQEEIRIMAQVG